MFSNRVYILSLFIVLLASCKVNQKVATNLPEVKITGHKNRSVEVYRATKDNYMDLLHTRLEISPVWEKAQLQGKAWLTMKPYFYATDSVNIDAKAFDIHEVKLIAGGETRDLNFTYDSAVIHIKLNKKYTQNDTFKLFIAYTAKPNELPKGGSKAIREDKGLYFINHDGKDSLKPRHVWSQGETQASACWFPTIDIPNEKHTQEIVITREAGFVSLSNGKLLNSTKNADGTYTDFWAQTIPHSVYLTMIAIGDYKIVKDSWRGKEVSYYMEPQYEAMARPIFGRTPAMMEFFSNKLGVDFPWDKYAQIIVHDFVAGAMENTSAVTFNNFVQKDTRELLDNNDDETVAHELCHHWFGDLVTCESWSHLPLNESFANYSEYLWFEHYKGRAYADETNYSDAEAYYKQSKQKVQPLIRFDYGNQEEMFDVLSYNKGGRVLHHLRKTLGDEAFFKGLKLYLTKFAYKTAEISNLRQCFEEVTGLDLNWFFNQWFFVGGHPILTFDYVKTDSGVHIYTHQKHNIDDYFVYKLLMVVDVYGDTNKIKKSITITHVRDSFFIKTKFAKIHFVNIDVEKTTICERIDHKTTEEWIAQFKMAPLFNDKLEAIKYFKEHKDQEDVQRLLRAAVNSPFTMIAVEAVKAIKLKETDTGLVEKMINLAQYHKTFNVKTAAIDKLVKLNAEKYKDLFFKLLSDSSYRVEAEALKAIGQSDKKLAFAEAVKRKDTKNQSLKSIVMNQIAANGDSSYYGFFLDKLSRESGFQKAFAFGHLGTFLANKNDALFNNGFVLIKKFMDENKDEWFGKFAYQTAISNALKVVGDKKDEFSVKRTEVLNKMNK
ncbi:MAG: M1 family metallopeptidase [Bacteroidetes bacterium]|nr:M1 family metallopeptidase [Bacteroidota bacterium]